MGETNSQKWYFYHSGASSDLYFWLQKTNYFYHLRDIAIQSDKSIFSNLTVSLWGPSGHSFSRDFFPEDILCEKTSAIRNCKNCSNNLEFMNLGGFSAPDSGVLAINLCMSMRYIANGIIAGSFCFVDRFNKFFIRIIEIARIIC